MFFVAGCMLLLHSRQDKKKENSIILTLCQDLVQFNQWCLGF
jgi:hypothetical protein